MNSVAHKNLIPVLSASALLMVGALVYGPARAGDVPPADPEITQYLRLHDEATRVVARTPDPAPEAAGESCVRQAEQPRPNRKGVRG